MTKIKEIFPQGIPEATEGKDIKLAVNEANLQKLDRVIARKTKMLGRAGSYEFKHRSVSRNSDFAEPVYDLKEISRAMDVEPYIAQSVRKHREQILKEGYIIRGEDDEMVAYIKKRLFEIALATGHSTESWIREFVTNLIIYHTSTLVVRRSNERSSGRRIRKYGRTLDPIAGIFVADPTTMEVDVDKYGTIKRWKQVMDSHLHSSAYRDLENQRIFDVDDVVCATVDKKSGYSFGTPYILPVLDDIRALRKLEELVVILSSKEAFPLYHYRVGTEQRPAAIYDDNTTEVESMTAQVAGLPAQGFIVTSERHEVTLVSRSGAALDINPFLTYYEDRVMAGLRLSPQDLGRGGAANRSTSSTISKIVQDSAKDYQQAISECLSFHLIMPLLMEGGFDVTEENMVTLSFPMIDREELRAHQTHGLNLMLSNAISIAEFRKDYLDKQPMSDEEISDTHRQREQGNQMELIAEQARLAPKPASGGSGDASIVNKVKTTNQPKNQHGTSPTKPRTAANDIYSASDNFISNLKTALKTNDSVDNMEVQFNTELHAFIDEAVNLRKPMLEAKISSGWDSARTRYELANDNAAEVPDLGEKAIERFHRNFVNKSYFAVIKPVMDNLKSCYREDAEGNNTVYNIPKVLEELRVVLHKLHKDQEITSYRFGFASYAKRISHKSVEITNNLEDSRVVDLQQLQYKNLLPNEGDIDINFSDA